MVAFGGRRAAHAGQFSGRGIDTPSGRLTANEAAIQVLTLPVLILGWGLSVAVVMAFT